MKFYQKWKEFFYSKQYYDALFLVGVSVFVVALVIGLFPSEDSELVAGRDFFVFVAMTVPVVLSIYLIIISFKDELYSRVINIRFSIRKKVTLAFVFISILPTILIVLPSNNFIHNSINKMVDGSMADSFREALKLNEEVGKTLVKELSVESDILRMKLSNNLFPPENEESRILEKKALEKRGYLVCYFRAQQNGKLILLNSEGPGRKISAKLKVYFENRNFYKSGVERLFLYDNEYFLSTVRSDAFLTAVLRKIPGEISVRSEMFASAIAGVKNIDYQKTYFLGISGLFFLILSLLVIGISLISGIILSKNITSPVLLLTEAAGQVASGNFRVRLKKRSDDELALLFDSFNQMVSALENSRKILYQKQNLENWKEMAKKIVHEIKNPLTPIRLSAERMRRRYIEKHSDIERVILTGTETIIDEVDSLMSLLSEFTVFARLPEIKLMLNSINSVIESCVNIFEGHDKIEIVRNFSDEIPVFMFDVQLIRQALINIMKNAVESMDGKGRLAVTSALISDSGRYARVTVSDTGSGINEEDLGKIFDPGFSTKKAGSGLGLVISEKILLEHGGRIYCKSVKGRGSDFIIELPLGGD